MRCSVDDCDRCAALLKSGKPRHAGLCAAHAQRQKLGKPMSPPVREYGLHPLKRLELAALRLADVAADDEASYRRVREWIRRLASGYGKRAAKVQKRPDSPP